MLSHDARDVLRLCEILLSFLAYTRLILLLYDGYAWLLAVECLQILRWLGDEDLGRTHL
jgi:hypothetical protein